MKSSSTPPRSASAGPAMSVREWRGMVLAALFSAFMIGMTLSPALEHLEEDPDDGFPLSHYPMFTKARGETKKVIYPVGVDADGNVRTIHYKTAGSGGFNQIRRQIKRMVKDGKGDELCPEIASRVARSRRYGDVQTVRLVTGRFSYEEYFSGNKEPLTETIEASCPVIRTAGEKES